MQKTKWLSALLMVNFVLGSFWMSLSSISVYAAPLINVDLQIVSDGIAPFDVADTPGKDTSANNGRVRYGDTVKYRWNISVNGESATNVVVQFKTGPFNILNGAQVCPLGYTVVAGILNCSIGDVLAGSTLVKTLDLQFYSSNSNAILSDNIYEGYTLQNNLSVSASNLPIPVISSNTLINLTSLPQKELYAYSSISNQLIGAEVNPSTNQDGYLVKYYWGSNFPSLGGEFIDISSYNFNVALNYNNQSNFAFSGAVPYTWGSGGYCGNRDDIYLKFTCTQAGGPQTDITVSPSFNPLQKFDSSVISFVFWIPKSDVLASNGVLTLNANITNFDPNGLSGQSNFGAATENPNNNNGTFTISSYNEFLLNKSYTYTDYSYTNFNGVNLNFTPSYPDSLIVGDLTVAGDILHSISSFQNLGASNIDDLVLCDNFDSTNQVVEYVRLGVYTNGVNGSFQQLNIPFEYSATPWTDSNTVCDASVGPWYSDINSIPGGKSAITRIRTTSIQPILPNQTVLFQVGSIVNQNLTSDRAQIFNTVAATSNNIVGQVGYYTTWVYATTVNPYVDVQTLPESKILPVNVASLAQINLGQKYFARLRYNPVTALSVIPEPLVVEYLVGPDQVFYPADTSLPPTEIVDNPDGSKLLKWIFNNPTPNQTNIIDVALSIKDTANIASYNNQARTYYKLNSALIENFTDLNNLNYIYSNYTSDCISRNNSTCNKIISVYSPNTFNINKTTLTPVLGQNSDLNYAINYRNFTATTIPSFQMIDILPYNGDGRTPASNFNGSLLFDSIAGTNNEVFEYTSKTPSQISNDPCDTSNIALGQTSVLCGATVGNGQTKWCSSFNTAGCPSSPSQVTAVRILGPSLAGNGPSFSLNLNLKTLNNQNGNSYTNFVFARAQGFLLPVFSNAAAAGTVIATPLTPTPKPTSGVTITQNNQSNSQKSEVVSQNSEKESSEKANLNQVATEFDTQAGSVARAGKVASEQSQIQAQKSQVKPILVRTGGSDIDSNLIKILPLALIFGLYLIQNYRFRDEF